ncbi:MAG: hypothetical protein EZS28_047461 [Streblomastix strix]|uniref:Uncharacterized protein n=1 Tax=Streblomastix strix TaxID=222440 RepID=A0A5J4TGJ2_9EUKA|nr:MAG: hypothetical protein EZS28_047461 [Streblomastix strix]
MPEQFKSVLIPDKEPKQGEEQVKEEVIKDKDANDIEEFDDYSSSGDLEDEQSDIDDNQPLTKEQIEFLDEQKKKDQEREKRRSKRLKKSVNKDENLKEPIEEQTPNRQ